MITAKLRKRSFTRSDSDNVAADDTVDIMGCSAVNTLGPAYNERFNAWKSVRCSRVFVVTELFNIAVNEMVLAQH